MILRRSPTPALGLLALAVIVLSGCSPEPQPTPTPTPAFASEEEAFAAAEEVYRAYNDAGNARRDGQDLPDPQSFLIGNALEGDIDAHNLLQARGLSVEGHVRVDHFEGADATINSESSQIVAVVCLDASQTRVVDEAGIDVTPADRDPRVAQEVTFVGVRDVLRISLEESTSVTSC